MGFEKFGEISFISETKVSDFINYLEQGKIMATRCQQCQASYFPPRMDCPRCLNNNMGWFEIKKHGKLVNHVQVNYAPAGFESSAPYYLAIGEFADGVKIFSRLSRDIKKEDIQTGMNLKVVPVKLPGNRLSYEFQKG